MAVSINSGLASLMGDSENRLEICKLEIDPDPRLQTLCFLELPPLASHTLHFFNEALKKWVPTSKSYVQTRSSRVYQLPFYTSEVGTIALQFRYRVPEKFVSSYALIINVAALVSTIPTDLRNVPWEDWGPSSTDLFQLATTGPISLGPYWMTDVRTRVVRQHDLWRTRHTQLMAGDKPSLESRPPKSDSTNVFQHDIKTHLPYRDVMGYKDKDLYNNSGYALVADREWAIGVAGKVGGYHVTV